MPQAILPEDLNPRHLQDLEEDEEVWLDPDDLLVDNQRRLWLSLTREISGKAKPGMFRTMKVTKNQDGYAVVVHDSEHRWSNSALSLWKTPLAPVVSFKISDSHPSTGDMYW